MEFHEETNRTANHNQKRKSRFWLSSIASGVVGSMLTFAIYPYANGYIDNLPFGNNENDPTVANKASVSSSGTTNNIPVKNTSYSKPASSVADMVQESSKAIVGVVNFQDSRDQFQGTTGNVEKGTGSGVIYKEDKSGAYIITNNHVIEGANEVEVSLFNGKKTKAEIIGADALTDLAVLRIKSSYASNTVSLGDSSKLRPGDQVIAIGNPLGLDLSRTVTEGIVSATGRTVPVQTSQGEWELNVIQTDAAINPGNSGGALFNTQGKVVGINSLKITQNGAEGLGFAIPSNDVSPIVNELIEKGKVIRPYVGVGLSNLEEIPQIYLQTLPAAVKKGVVVTNVDPVSAAAKAGIQAKDVIVSINGHSISSSSDFRKYLYTKANQQKQIVLAIYRDGKKVTTTLQVADLK
jgi:serine protease Do